MMYLVEIKEEARVDILGAAGWYADKSHELNLKFIQQIEATLKSIRNNPKTFKKVYKNFRQAALKKFPYVIMYEHDSKTVIVFSVFHTSKHPHKKLKRLRK